MKCQPSRKPEAWSQTWEEQFLLHSAHRIAAVSTPFLCAIAAFELWNICYTLWYTDFALGTLSSRIYTSLYVILLAASLASLFLIRRWARRGKPRPVIITQNLYAAVILLWSVAVTAYDQRASEQIYVYLLTIISVAILARMRPAVSIPLFLSAQALLMALLPVFQANPGDNYGEYINSLAFCLMSILISVCRYGSDRERFHQRMVIEDTNRQLQEKSDQLAYVADHDSLTGLRNRRYLGIYLQELIRSCQADPRRQAAVFMIDVDNFKDYNDVYGHVKGDECLRRVAQAMEAAWPHGSLFRYGGEEFLLILPGDGDLPCGQAAAALCRAVEALGIPAAQAAEPVTISIGCAVGPVASESAWDALLRAADRALYQAKSQGKNRYSVPQGCGSL